MNTAKPIATISFNSVQFLKARLEELTKAKRLDFWCFIPHKAEDDEAGKKPHIHLYLEPAKRLQTATLVDEFKEYDPKHPDKPLKCLSFRPSKFSDWYMYALHDRVYLTAKNQSRKFHYLKSDIVSLSEDELHFRVCSVDMSDLTPVKRLQEFQQAGKSFPDAVSSGLVPLPQINQYEKAWQMLKSNQTDRNSRAGHEDPAEDPPKFDPETGEVLE